MNSDSIAHSEEALASLVFEAQTTVTRTHAVTDTVFNLVKRFVHLYSQLPVKPEGAALLYQEFGSLEAHSRDLESELVVGRLSKSERHPDGSDLAIEDAQMSRRHFTVSCAEGFYLLRDLGSHNGTYLNNESEKIHERLLKAGDVILAGTSFFIFTGGPALADEEVVSGIR